MKSPITGKPMPIQIGRITLTFKGEKFKVFYLFYQCQRSKEQYTSTYLDTITLDQVYLQYAGRHGLNLEDVIPKEDKSQSTGQCVS